jgi:hypothetical protein
MLIHDRLEASRAAAAHPGVRAAPLSKGRSALWMTETSPTMSRRGETNIGKPYGWQTSERAAGRTQMRGLAQPSAEVV